MRHGDETEVRSTRRSRDEVAIVRVSRRLPGRLFATRGRRELALFASVYLLYDGARWVFVGHLGPARAHARWVIHLERALHVAVEGQVQHALDSGVTSFLLSNLYLAAQLIVLPGALIWLYRSSPEIYRKLRNTVAAVWLISTPIFALYPVAPPRLAGIGIKDTVSHQAGVALTGHSTIFYNPYAAVPSLHVGLAFAIGLAIAAAVTSRWAKALALCWGPLVMLAVLATGNHFLFDGATGLLVTALAYALTRQAPRLSVSYRRTRPSRARAVPALRFESPLRDGARPRPAEGRA
jgi:membrane-associated phospholipid phosphatase